LGTDEFKAAGMAQGDGGGRSAPQAIGDEAHLDPAMGGVHLGPAAGGAHGRVMAGAFLGRTMGGPQRQAAARACESRENEAHAVERQLKAGNRIGVASFSPIG
jgi:hypothetical protein